MMGCWMGFSLFRYITIRLFRRDSAQSLS